MTVNIYDDINKLQVTFQATNEFKALEEAIELVKSDEQALQLFLAFRDVQTMLQQKQMSGEDATEEELAEAQNAAANAQQNEKIMTMLEAEMQLSEVLNEVNRVLVQPIQNRVRPDQARLKAIVPSD